MRDVKVAQALPVSSIAMQLQRRRLEERRFSMNDEIISGNEEKLVFLFQLDMLLSHEYLAAFRRRQLEPEKRLMLAVLEDAVACFQSYVFAQNRRKQTLFNEAEDWIRDENGDHVFSFENICAALKFNPKYVREGLLRWKMRKLAERPKIQLINIPSAGRKSVIRKRDTNRMIERVKQPYREKKIARLG